MDDAREILFQAVSQITHEYPGEPGLTYVALLTPPGTAAIATIAVQGAEAWSIAQRIFQRANGRPLPKQPRTQKFWYGRVGGQKGDEVILAVRMTEPAVWTEYHCHGGQVVIEWLLKLLSEQNCKVVRWSEFLHLPGVVSDKDHRVLGLLPEARTLRTASLLLDQYHGAYRKAVHEAINFLQNNELQQAQALIEGLLCYAEVGLHLTRPWRAVIAGQPNAGKSSLFNALAGYQRSVVAPIPGTTRDVLTTTLALAGWPIDLSDTAGLRESTDFLEQEGVARARRTLEKTDLCLWVIDVTGDPPPGLVKFASENGLNPDHVLPVLNKIDQPAGWDVSRFPDAPRVSALTNSGIDRLIERVIHHLIPSEPVPGTAIPYAEAQIDSLRLGLSRLLTGDRPGALTWLIHSSQSNDSTSAQR